MDPRVLQATHEVVRLFPGGAPTIAIIDAIVRVGLTAAVAYAVLDDMQRRGVLELHLGRWRAAEPVDAPK